MEYEGDFIWGSKTLSKYVKGYLVFVRNDTGWKILDASIGGTFADRYMKLAVEGFPVPRYDFTGKYAVQNNLTSIGVVIKCVDAPDEGARYRQVNEKVVFSSVVGRGIVFAGGDIRVDGMTPFYYFDDGGFGLTNTVRDLTTQWRVRYRDDEYLYMKGFFFKVIPDEIIGGRLNPQCDGVFAPPEWKEKLWDVLHGEL